MGVSRQKTHTAALWAVTGKEFNNSWFIRWPLKPIQSFCLHWSSVSTPTPPSLSSHLSAEEHTQEEISEDCKKEGFDSFASPVSTSRSRPVCLFSFPSDEPQLLEALFQQCIYIS